MATINQHIQAPVGAASAETTRAAAGGDGPLMAARLTTEQVWHQLAKGSFAVLSHITPAGEPFDRNPFGTAIEGCPVRLNTGFKLLRESSDINVNITASTSAMARATSCMITARRRLACR